MQHVSYDTESQRYGKCIEVSKRIRWDIDEDVIRGRRFDFSQKFLPDGLSLVDRLDFLLPHEQRLLSQIQGRSYANIFGLVERFINAKVLEVSRDHWFGDQTALEALIRFSDEELKHQALFRRIEKLIGHIELFTQVHYKQSIAPDPELSALFKDVFLYHWREESQHAILDELEWVREDARLSDAERDAAVDDLIALVGAVDGILQQQAVADAQYLFENVGRTLSDVQREQIAEGVLKAYRWQYIVSGVQGPFATVLERLVTPAQHARIGSALAPILN
jgi:hypothetical protein